jgi:hypothetical protein
MINWYQCVWVTLRLRTRAVTLEARCWGNKLITNNIQHQTATNQQKSATLQKHNTANPKPNQQTPTNRPTDQQPTKCGSTNQLTNRSPTNNHSTNHGLNKNWPTNQPPITQLTTYLWLTNRPADWPTDPPPTNQQPDRSADHPPTTNWPIDRHKQTWRSCENRAKILWK